MTRRSAVLFALLALGAPAVRSAPAMQTGALPAWETSASGPLRSSLTNANETLSGDLVIVFDNYTDTTYGYTLGPLTGAYRFSVPFAFDTGWAIWTGYALEGESPPASMADMAARDLIICDPATGGNLVMLWGPDMHEHGKFDGIDTAAPTYTPFGSTTGTMTVSRSFSVDSLPAFEAARRNWYAPWLLATNPALSSVTGHTVAFEALVLPEGLYCTTRSPNEFIVAERPMIAALVGRYRSGLAPANIPVNVDHGAPVTGRVTRVWAVAGSGLWARIEAHQSAVVGKPYLSAEIRSLRATAADAWGAWAEFSLPWALTGVALTDDPAIAGTHYELRNAPACAYPDPRTINGTWKRKQ